MDYLRAWSRCDVHTCDRLVETVVCANSFSDISVDLEILNVIESCLVVGQLFHYHQRWCGWNELG